MYSCAIRHYNPTIGHNALQDRGSLAVSSPLADSYIQNWDDMEHLWHHIYNQMGVAPQEHPVLMTEKVQNPKASREKSVQILFEQFGIPGLHCSIREVLSLYAAGSTNGLVLGSGDGATHAVPIYEGFCLPHAVLSSAITGSRLTTLFRGLLEDRGEDIAANYGEHVLRDMKNKLCFVARDPNIPPDIDAFGVGSSYELPDRQIISVSDEGFQTYEAFFQPDLIEGQKILALTGRSSTQSRSAIETFTVTCSAKSFW